MNESLEALGQVGGTLLAEDDFESLAILASRVESWAVNRNALDIERARAMVQDWIAISSRRRDHFKTRLLARQASANGLKSYAGQAIAV